MKGAWQHFAGARTSTDGFYLKSHAHEEEPLLQRMLRFSQSTSTIRRCVTLPRPNIEVSSDVTITVSRVVGDDLQGLVFDLAYWHHRIDPTLSAVPKNCPPNGLTGSDCRRLMLVSIWLPIKHLPLARRLLQSCATCSLVMMPRHGQRQILRRVETSPRRGSSSHPV